MSRSWTRVLTAQGRARGIESTAKKMVQMGEANESRHRPFSRARNRELCPGNALRPSHPGLEVGTTGIAGEKTRLS